jgi:hypothetical protein
MTMLRSRTIRCNDRLARPVRAPRLTAFALLMISLGAARPVGADVVLDWNQIAVATTAGNPFTQARFLAITQLAVFDAVNAVTGDYEPYIGGNVAPPGASAEAAAITAAHAVLTHYFPGSTAMLNVSRDGALGVIADGPGKSAGIQAGLAAAAALIKTRLNDGSAPAPAGIVPAGSAAPGVWQRTPSCPPGGGVFGLWSGVTPFGIRSARDFVLAPPPALTSNRYAKDFKEVNRVGGVGSAERPLDRADVATFYAAASPGFIFNAVARQLSLARGDSLSENARNLALVNMAINDALIASFMNKYIYNFWRPETAIPGADSDGNRKTSVDPAAPPFVPFIVTPCFPSYPSNHASGSGAGAEMLRRIYGAGGHAVRLESPATPSIVLDYTKLQQIVDDVDDARVFGGIHFRFEQVAGGRLGRDVATYVYKNNLRRARH